MYEAARAEAAEFYGDPRILDLKVHFSDFFQKFGPGSTGGMAFTDFGTIENPLPFARGIWVDSALLPYMYEDELRYTFLHELTHASLPWTADHGPDFLERVSYLTGYPDATLDLRQQNHINNFGNWMADLFGGRVPDEKLHTLGPLFE